MESSALIDRRRARIANPSSGSEGAPRGGFTLIELCIAISLLMIGMVSVISATTRMHSLRRQNRERTLSQNAIRSVAERIHAQSYRFSDSPDTWSQDLIGVFGPGGSVGNTFPVRGLNIVPGDATVGTLQIITDETVTDDTLGVQVGMPRDLDGDGAATNIDVANNARVLPVLITLRWRSQSGGVITQRHAFYVMGY